MEGKLRERIRTYTNIPTPHTITTTPTSASIRSSPLSSRWGEREREGKGGEQQGLGEGDKREGISFSGDWLAQREAAVQSMAAHSCCQVDERNGERNHLVSSNMQSRCL